MTDARDKCVIYKQVVRLLLRKSRSYGVVWSSRARRAACWWWLFQRRTFGQFACSQYAL